MKHHAPQHDLPGQAEVFNLASEKIKEPAPVEAPREDTQTGDLFGSTFPPTAPDAGYWTREEFERWLSLQEAIGNRCTTPDSIAKVRAAFDAGAKVSRFFKDDQCRREDLKSRITPKL